MFDLWMDREIVCIVQISLNLMKLSYDMFSLWTCYISLLKCLLHMVVDSVVVYYATKLVVWATNMHPVSTTFFCEHDWTVVSNETYITGWPGSPNCVHEPSMPKCANGPHTIYIYIYYYMHSWHPKSIMSPPQLT